MATIASATSSASSLTSGQTCEITVVIDAAQSSSVTETIAFTIDGSTADIKIDIPTPGETITYSPTPDSNPGVLSDTISGGSLSNQALKDNGNGTWTFTATYTAP